MAIQTMYLDPNATSYTGDEMIALINAGADDFEREDLLNQDLLRIIKTTPASGQFNVKNIQRHSDGTLEVQYDDVAVP